MTPDRGRPGVATHERLLPDLTASRIALAGLLWGALAGAQPAPGVTPPATPGAPPLAPSSPATPPPPTPPPPPATPSSPAVSPATSSAAPSAPATPPPPQAPAARPPAPPQAYPFPSSIYAPPTPPPLATATPPAAPPTVRRWYGWQTLIADGASLAFALAGSQENSNRSSDNSEVLLGLGAAGFALGAPIIHWSHGHVGKGFLSLGLRVGTPLVAYKLLSDGLEHEGEGRFALGLLLLLGWIPASISIDAAVIARENVPAKVTLTPLLAPTRGGGTLGLGGTFLSGPACVAASSLGAGDLGGVAAEDLEEQPAGAALERAAAGPDPLQILPG